MGFHPAAELGSTREGEREGGFRINRGRTLSALPPSLPFSLPPSLPPSLRASFASDLLFFPCPRSPASLLGSKLLCRAPDIPHPLGRGKAKAFLRSLPRDKPVDDVLADRDAEHAAKEEGRKGGREEGRKGGREEGGKGGREGGKIEY